MPKLEIECKKRYILGVPKILVCVYDRTIDDINPIDIIILDKPPRFIKVSSRFEFTT